MCRQIVCNTCKKITWAGCGKHIDAVFKNVPVENRCKCRENKESKTPVCAPGSKGICIDPKTGGKK